MVAAAVKSKKPWSLLLRFAARSSVSRLDGRCALPGPRISIPHGRVLLTHLGEHRLADCLVMFHEIQLPE